MVGQEILLHGTQEKTPQKENGGDIHAQIDHYLGLRRYVLGDEQRTQAQHEFLTQTYMGAIDVRIRRAAEIASPKVQGAISIAREIMKEDDRKKVTKGVICIDGRVVGTNIFGFPDSHKDLIESPAGEVPEFARNTDHTLTLLKDSPFRIALDKVLERKDEVVEILDSHVACAARGIESSRITGSLPPDNGLRHDVLKKKEMADALKKHESAINDTSDVKKKITPIQTSYNPADGYMFMGLETDESLAASRDTGFTNKKLKQLAEEGKIISTYHLVNATEEGQEENPVKRLFEAHRIADFSWDKNYADTTSHFWNNLKSMIEETNLIDYISERVRGVYPNMDADEIAERAKLLAMNAYNAFHEKPFTEHTESIIVVSPGENGPYEDHNAFCIGEERQFPKIEAAIGLAESLVRKNRAEGRVENTSQQFTEQEFIEAPVPLIVKTEIKKEADDVEWDKLNGILEEDRVNEDPDRIRLVPSNWYDLDTESYKAHVSSFELTDDMTDAIVSLHHKMREFYNYETTTDDRLLNGELEVMPALGNRSSGISAVIPFVYAGHPVELVN